MSLEADESFWKRFEKLPDEAKDALERVLKRLESDSTWLPEGRGEVDGKLVYCQPLGSGWVCGCVPIYSDYRESEAPPPAAPSNVLLCLYESRDTDLVLGYLPPISS
jgi:hypothetical protein